MAIPKIREQIEARVKDTGDTMTGRLVQTLNGNPYYELNDGTNRWFFQAIKADNASYIGPTSIKALKIDTDGNATVRGSLTVDGSIIGSIQEAVKATQDGNGNVITSTYLPLSGGTIVGTSGDTPLYLKSASTTAWLGFKNSGGTNLGFFGFSGSNIPAVYLDKTYKLLYDGNYNSYSPTLTGGGASGTWNISISGNAATATKATQDGNGANIASTYLKLSGGTMTGNVYFPNNKGIIQNQGATSNYTNIITWLQGGVSENTYDPQIGHHNTGDTNGAIILLPYSTANSPWNGADGLYIGSKNLYYNGSSVLNTSNYNSYAPTKTGGGASGTWPISISGSAGSVSWGNVSGKPDFSGTLITYTINLSSYSTSNFYFVDFGTSILELDCEIHSRGASAGDPWNQNVLHFLMVGQGWSDTPKNLTILNQSFYDGNEKTIMSIVHGNQAGVRGVYLRGGLTYTIRSNFAPNLNTTTKTQGNESYASGTTSYTTITNATTLWTNDGVSKSIFSMPVNAVMLSSTDYTTYRGRSIASNTGALTSGSTALSNGYIYLQYK